MSSLTPSLSPSADPQAVQPFACVRCWKRKKKCNKLLPTCDRCSRTREACVYSAQPPTRRSETQLHLSNSKSDHTLHDRTSLTPAVLNPGIHPLLTLPAHNPWLSSQLLSVNAQDILIAQIHIILATIEYRVESICTQFLNTINTWIPMIIECQLRECLRHFNKSQSDICVLILAIYLVTYPTGDTLNRDTIYAVVKQFHSNLQSSNSISILSIQTGLLVAIYEHGQMLDQECYLSIGSCARMGYALCIHKALEESPPTQSADVVAFETRKHVWWAVVIMERVLAFGTINFGRPFACREPRLVDYLPSFSGHDLEVNTVGKATPEQFGATPSLAFKPVNPYARTVQATYILSLVFSHILRHHQSDEARLAYVDYLDKILRTFAFSALEQGENDKNFSFGHSCGAFSIALYALWALHEDNLRKSGEYNHHIKRYSSHPPSTSLLALRSLTRTAIEISQNKVGDPISGARFTPSFAVAGVRAAIDFHVRTGPDIGFHGEWLQEIDSMLLYLQLAGERWNRDKQSFERVKLKLSSLVHVVSEEM